MFQKKMALIVAMIAVIIAAVLVVFLSDDINLVTKLPKGYCKVQEDITLSLGDAPKKVTISDSKTVAIVLVDVKQGSASYFVTDEAAVDAGTFIKISQTKDEDTKFWEDSLLLRTTSLLDTSTTALLAKKCTN
jgi:hypothetical protein